MKFRIRRYFAMTLLSEFAIAWLALFAGLGLITGKIIYCIYNIIMDLFQ
jgi:hypothetical protein